MSVLPTLNADVMKCMQDIFTIKPYTKIDAIGRLHVINALDNGQSRVDIAKQYNVHPQTIAYIYKQKESIIKKCKQKLTSLKDIRFINLDLVLLEWFKNEIKSGNNVSEEQLLHKAQESIQTTNEEFSCLDDWLEGFRNRYNIKKHTSDSYIQFTKEWNNLITEFNINNVYVGSTSALYYKLNLESYVNESKVDDKFSLLYFTNTTGTDKREVLVAGEEHLADHDRAQSLPVDYYVSDKCLVTFNMILSYLSKWDYELNYNNRHIVVVLDVPETFINNINLNNIKILPASGEEALKKSFEKIVLCFKHHYRKLQISKFFNCPNLIEQPLSVYLHMISLAWHSIHSEYIHRIFYPPQDGSLYLSGDDDDAQYEEDYSLSTWSKSCDLPFDANAYLLLDKFMLCDNQLPSLSNEIDNECVSNVLVDNCESTSGIEAYQAMKRLIAYLQGENATAPVVESARILEDQLECSALTEIHQFMSSRQINNYI